MEVTSEDNRSSLLRSDRKLKSIKGKALIGGYWRHLLRAALAETRQRLCTEKSRFQKERCELIDRLIKTSKLTLQSRQKLERTRLLSEQSLALKRVAECALEKQVILNKETEIEFRAQQKELLQDLARRDNAFVSISEHDHFTPFSCFLASRVDSLVHFFVATLRIILGTSKYQNQKFNDILGPRFLIGFIANPKVSQNLQEVALQALSASLWDGHTDFRFVTHKLRLQWAAFYQAQQTSIEEFQVYFY